MYKYLVSDLGEEAENNDHKQVVEDSDSSNDRVDDSSVERREATGLLRRNEDVVTPCQTSFDRDEFSISDCLKMYWLLEVACDNSLAQQITLQPAL